MSVGYGYPAPGGDRGRMRAADADRERVVESLKHAYSEGRLTAEEYEDRVERALSARTYDDLDALVSDLPGVRTPMVAPAAPVAPVTTTNGYAIASFVCGLGQFVAGPLTTIPAIVFGHMARGQIRRTGEQGSGLALAGLVLGWGAVILGVVLIVTLGLVVSTGMHAHGAVHPGP